MVLDKLGVRPILDLDMRLGEGRRKVNAAAILTRRPDGTYGHCFHVRGRANRDFITHLKTVYVADFDIRRAGGGVGREERMARLGANARDRERLDPMADAVDIQPDLVTG